MVDFVLFGKGDARTFNLYDFYNPSAVFFAQTATSWKVSFDGGKVSEITGTNFVYDQKNGMPDGPPISGTTTAATGFVNGVALATISDLSITTPQAIQYIISGNPIAVSMDVFKGDDTISGSDLFDFDDYLDGWGGADTLSGKGGNDTYVVDNVGDQVIELASKGTDTVLASVNVTLAANVENLTLTGTAIKGTGNALANKLTGNGANNTLDGLGGSDTMIGGAGTDTYFVDRSTDVVLEKAKGGSDTVKAAANYTLAAKQEIEFLKTTSDGGKAAIKLTGNEFANTITGNSGANVLDGGLGKDVLKGGAGKDTFLFDTKIGSANIDHIKDFKAVDDTIKLENAIFKALTKTGTLHDDAFALIKSAKDIVDDDVHILYDKAHGALYYDPNGGSASGRVEIAVLDNRAALTHVDILIA